MILGERNFISLDDNGKFNFMLKLDYAPKCFTSFVVGYYWGENLFYSVHNIIFN